MMIRRVAWVLVSCAALCGACAGPSENVRQRVTEALAAPATPSAAADVAAAAAPPCGDPAASLRPPSAMPPANQMPAATYMKTIQDRGRLIAGIDQTTLLFGVRNPRTGRIEGFDADVLREVARAIFGNPDAIEFKAINFEARLTLVQQGAVDIIADRVTMTCQRWGDVSFTSEYFHGAKKLATLTGNAANQPSDLSGKTVCVAAGSTTRDLVARLIPTAKLLEL